MKSFMGSMLTLFTAFIVFGIIRLSQMNDDKEYYDKRTIHNVGAIEEKIISTTVSPKKDSKNVNSQDFSATDLAKQATGNFSKNHHQPIEKKEDYSSNKKIPDSIRKLQEAHKKISSYPSIDIGGNEVNFENSVPDKKSTKPYPPKKGQ